MASLYDVSIEAQNDLFEIWRRIAEDSIGVADRIDAEFHELFASLGRIPHQGHIRKDLAKRPVLFISLYSFLVVYQPDVKPIRIAPVPAVDAHQCFPPAYLKDSVIAQFRQHYSEESITREEVFHCIYALLHHPQYRERYAANLRRELPRIPFAPDFTAFTGGGSELSRLHVEYESVKPWPLKYIENKDAPYSERVTKMKLSPDRQSVAVNESLTLGGIPQETFEYRLGSRSALEWVIDQYQVKGESDPNREDDPGYIVRLVGQVVRVSVETVRIVRGLPNYR